LPFFIVSLIPFNKIFLLFSFSFSETELIDPTDLALDFVAKRDTVKPIAIFRIEDTFLLCYNEFGFFVGKNGRRVKNDWIVQWECEPTSFAYQHPHVLAISSSFIEIRNVESGEISQIIPTLNLSCFLSTNNQMFAVTDLFETPSPLFHQIYSLLPGPSSRKTTMNREGTFRREKRPSASTNNLIPDRLALPHTMNDLSLANLRRPSTSPVATDMSNRFNSSGEL